MKEQVLMSLGLSQNEAKVYVSLIEKGFSSATKIAEASGIHRVNVYDSIARLKERGLASEMIYEGKKGYQASPPAMLKNILMEKEIKLNKIIPELELNNTLNKNEQTVQIYEGYDYIRNMFLHFLELKEDIFAIDAPKFAIDKVGRFFQEVIHKRRAEQKQMMYHLYNRDAVERIRFLNTLPYTEAKCLNQENNNTATTFICGEEVAISIMHEREDLKPMSILIKNKQVADAYKMHFWIIWEKAIAP
ncbi:helix-turn-helix domain-containing protein [Candidatus Woesearchaeota archaeon]|nr:helix-turn-helix domain-containing protein [Candidatus Woesearchaeota archaeon]